MYYDDDCYYEIEYLDEEDYEEARREDSANLHRRTISLMEERYQCTFPSFILLAQTDKEREDLMSWCLSIRYLARHENNMYV
ncbi:hypothetical protein [Ammoniphilus sp. YIM 78166]|uniref:hypothetical protein n=1 Tax=Ammoniphilus sp. YIM 78166 TaxID=1644106 RepID=UPI00106FAFAA|nr:hypothetical protein [Ammoniphilus sp. YIM 78166]